MTLDEKELSKLRAKDFELNVPKTPKIKPEEIDIKKFRNISNVKAKDDTQMVSYDDALYYIKEIKKCKDDPIYFAEKYFYIVTWKGKEVIRLYDKQKDMINSFINNAYTICVASRQSGKTLKGNTKAIICLPNGSKQSLSLKELWDNYGIKIS